MKLRKRVKLCLVKGHHIPLRSGNQRLYVRDLPVFKLIGIDYRGACCVLNEGFKALREVRGYGPFRGRGPVVTSDEENIPGSRQLFKFLFQAFCLFGVLWVTGGFKCYRSASIRYLGAFH